MSNTGHFRRAPSVSLRDTTDKSSLIIALLIEALKSIGITNNKLPQAHTKKLRDSRRRRNCRRLDRRAGPLQTSRSSQAQS
jgi:hypothetical protein